MSEFFINYQQAYSHAVQQARATNKVVQLEAGQEYNRKGFYVRSAIQKPELRFGSDARGEFISPNDPVTEMRK